MLHRIVHRKHCPVVPEIPLAQNPSEAATKKVSCTELNLGGHRLWNHPVLTESEHWGVLTGGGSKKSTRGPPKNGWFIMA